MIVPGLKFIFYKFCYLSGYQRILLERIRTFKYIPILSLHRISPVPSAWPPLKPSDFEYLIKFLKKNFQIVTFETLDAKDGAKPKVILSFDDGYYDFIEYAMPILKKHNVRVNHNIIPSQLLGEKALWNIALYDFLNAAPLSLIKEIELPDIKIDHDYKRRSHINIALRISRALKRLSYKERDMVMHQLEESVFNKLEPYPKTRMIRLSEINQVLSEHEVGAHSYSHNSMGEESIDYFIEDFVKCKNFFATYNFPELQIYAFPNGSYTNAQVRYLENQGIKHILLVGDGYSNGQSPHQRINVGAVTPCEAVFQALGMKVSKNVSVVPSAV